jgi:hypothetical protein
MCGKTIYPGFPLEEDGRFTQKPAKHSNHIPSADPDEKAALRAGVLSEPEAGLEGGQEIMEETRTCTAQAQRDRKVVIEKASILKKCHQCGNNFKPKRKNSRFCSKPCNDKFYKSHPRGTKKDGPGRKKRGSPASISTPRDPGFDRSPTSIPIISDAVTLDAQLLRAVKKSAILDFIKNELPQMVEKAFA